MLRNTPVHYARDIMRMVSLQLYRCGCGCIRIQNYIFISERSFYFSAKQINDAHLCACIKQRQTVSSQTSDFRCIIQQVCWCVGVGGCVCKVNVQKYLSLNF